MDLINPAVSDYLLAHRTPAEETRKATGGAAGMQISHDEGEFLTMLVRLIGARRAVEVGVFTGYSSLCIARGLPTDGHLLACDVSEEWTSIAQRYWTRAAVADRIELPLAPALETLRALPNEEAIDFAFIDADKISYPDYYEELVPRLRPGGLIALDNVLRAGGVLNSKSQDPSDIAMRHMNDTVVNDKRVDSVMLPVRDGLTLARKRGPPATTHP